MSVVKIDKVNYEDEVLKSDKKVLLDFYADWCGPCRMLSVVIDKIAPEYPEIKICKVNVDEQPELASSYGVMTIPALFVVENGKVIKNAVGAKNKTELLKLLNE